MTTRADDVVLLQQNDILVAKFPNDVIFTSTKENVITRVISIECPGYATVTYLRNQCECTIKYRDGFRIECDSCGNYSIHNEECTFISLLSQGQAFYSPLSGGKYCFDYSGKGITLDAVDSSGYAIKINCHGDVETSLPSPQHVDPHNAFKPRIFIINPDGSGYEFIDSTKIEKIINIAQCENRNTVLKDIIIPDTQFVSAVIMAPANSSVNDINTLPSASLSIPTRREYVAKSSVAASSNQENSQQDVALLHFNCYHFITFAPLSDDTRDILHTKEFGTSSANYSGCTGNYLQELWQHTIERVSSLLVNHVIESACSTTSQMKISSVPSKIMSKQDICLQTVLHAIHAGFIPAYFDNVSENGDLVESAGSKRNMEVVLLTPTSQVPHQLAESQNRLKIHDKSDAKSSPDTNEVCQPVKVSQC